MHRISVSITALLTAASSAVLAQTSAAPADNNDLWIENIVVTAQKREERIQDTPVAITALTNDMMVHRGISDVTQIAGTVPGLVIPQTVGAGQATNFYMRGLGQFDNYATVDPGVGVYLDGVYIGRSQAGIFDLADVERIEVLRGPQGTLYGKNTIGGVVNIITQKPSDEFSGKARFRVGSRNLLAGQASVNLPVIEEKVFAKVSVNARAQDGFVKSLITPDQANPVGNGPGRFGDSQKISARAAIRFLPNENLDLTLTGDIHHRRGTAAAFIARGGNIMAGIDPAFALTGNRETYAGYRAPEEDDGEGIALHAEYNLNDVTLRSITSYRHSKTSSGGDYDGAPVEFLDQQVAMDQDQFSQEFQVSGSSFDDRLHWVGGLYYFHESFSQRINVFGSEGTLYGTNVEEFIDSKVNSYAIFAQATYDLTHTLSVTAGGRYTKDKKSGVVFWDPFYGFFGSGPISQKGDWGAFTPRASIEWKPMDSLLLYASYTRGFRSGGINGRASVPPAAIPYGPETLDGFEAGFKSDMFNRRIRLNVAAYLNKYKDIQLIAIDTTGISFPTINGGKGEVYGAEVELEAQVTRAFYLTANYAYTHTEYTSLSPAVIAGSPTLQEGNWLPNAPRHTAAAGATFVQPVGNDGSEIRLHGDYRYRSFLYPFGENEFKNPGFGVLDARLTYASEGERWELSAYCLNCADNKYIEWGQYRANTFGFSADIPGTPREIGIELQTRF